MPDENACPIGEFRRHGKEYKIFKRQTGYVIFVDSMLVQHNLTPDDFVRWASNALEDGS